MAEPRYQAVLAVLAEGRTVTEVADQWGVSRQTMHAWLAKYEAGGLEGLADASRHINYPTPESGWCNGEKCDRRRL